MPGETGPSSARTLLRDTAGRSDVEVERKLALWELAWDNGFVRKAAIILLLALVWEAYGRLLDNSLLFPTLTETLRALAGHVADGSLPARAWASTRGSRAVCAGCSRWRGWSTSTTGSTAQ